MRRLNNIELNAVSAGCTSCGGTKEYVPNDESANPSNFDKAVSTFWDLCTRLKAKIWG